MSLIRLYPDWESAFFLSRRNRFVLELEKDGKRVEVYIANPGRMEEFLVEGQPFYITAVPPGSGKYPYRVVSTSYQDSYVLLDTTRVNDIVEEMLRDYLIEELKGVVIIDREVKVRRSRFDFLLHFGKGKRPVLLEVKSCSLCHKGVAMFPDAPTERGKRHLLELEELSLEDYDTANLYLVTNSQGRVFLPNCHTDREYGRVFNSLERVQLLAYGVVMPDPVTVDLDHCQRLPIAIDESRLYCSNGGGSYLMVLRCEQDVTKGIGALGERKFRKGYYVYVGSALKGVDARIRRHRKGKKKIRWHLDYVFPYVMKEVKVYPILGPGRMETRLAQKLIEISEECVPGFGSSDTELPSHFFYFPSNPIGRRDFQDLLLDFRMHYLLH